MIGKSESSTVKTGDIMKIKPGDRVRIHANPGPCGHSHGDCTGVAVQFDGSNINFMRVKIDGKKLNPMSKDDLVPFLDHEMTKIEEE
jgi:hypothetical protein